MLSGAHNRLDRVCLLSKVAFETAVCLPAKAVKVDDPEKAVFVSTYGLFDRLCQLDDLWFAAQLAKISHALPDLGEAGSQQSRIAGSGFFKAELALEYQKVLLRTPRLEHRNVASQAQIGNSTDHGDEFVYGFDRAILSE